MTGKTILAVGVGLLASAAALAEVPSRTNEFPAVALAAASDPRYVVISVDPFTNRLAYVLYDGNVKDGYGRIYVWMPEDPKYGRPVSATVAEGNKFPPLTFTSTNGDEAAIVSWQLSWERRTSGPRSYFDYTTGKTVNQGDSVTYLALPFDVDYMRGDRSLLGAGGAAAPLDVRIHGEVGASAVWTNLPAAVTPWSQLNFWMDVKSEYYEKGGALSFTGRLYYAHWPCTVHSLPKSAKVDLTVGPYLEGPSYSNTLTHTEALVTGVKVEVPFGWYDIMWRFFCPGLSVVSRQDYWIVLSPHPFPPRASGP